jgi:hypothetical protein
MTGFENLIISWPSHFLKDFDHEYRIAAKSLIQYLTYTDVGIGRLQSNMRASDGVCSTDLRLYTSTNGLKKVYTIPETIYEKTYFLKNVHLKIIYNF